MIFFSNLVNMAQERSYRIQCLAQADVIENILEKCRIELIYMSKNRITIEAAKAYLEYHNQAGDNIYGELAYVGSTDRNRFLLWNTGSSVLEIQSDQWSRINPNPMALFNSLQFLQPGQVKISDICETTYPNLLNQEGNSNPAAVIRLAVMCMNKNGKPEGCFLSVLM